MQILTHMREKLLFVSRRNRLLTREVSQLDSGLGAKRDSLSKLRQRRDALRQTATKIKETSVYIDNPLLLNDMQACPKSLKNRRACCILVPKCCVFRSFRRIVSKSSGFPLAVEKPKSSGNRSTEHLV